MIFATTNFGESYILEIVGTLAVLAFIIRKFPGPLVAKGVKDREQKIRSQLAAGEEARAAAEQLVTERRATLEQAKHEAEQIVAQARRAAEQIALDGQRQADDEYERLVRRADVEVVVARSRIQNEVAGEVGLLVLEAAEQVVRLELDPPSHRRLIDEAIAAAESETV